MNCLLTGSSGIVGSHIMFEWIYKALVEKTVNHLFVVIRNNKKPAKDRLLAILNDSSRPHFLNDFSMADCLSKITVIPSDLSNIKKQTLEKYNFSTVIHCAGSTSLQHTTDSKEKVQHQNFNVTKQLLTELPHNVKRFLYISTAYSFGIQKDKVTDTIANFKVQEFRNPYEKSKYESEKYVSETCAKKNIISQILRPSIICGRLIDAPFFETPKFDVFYAWAIFLNKYARKASSDFRIWIDQKSGLNIVPVDFVAKAVLHAFLQPNIKELNIVNPTQILHKNYVGDVLRYFKINAFNYVSERPENLNNFEQLYYKTIGVVFEKYISVPDLQFQSETILKFINQLNLSTNLGVHENFMKLIDFSVKKEFKSSYA
ncbi:SDR family oxidoreductase [Polaribacter tangerinus]|uniref:SDR family oxidoreductase n=1 Tax=Polaribacter tangerinus TaxID=1920034 RepID=UPI000B4AE37D|nr:SDR family oxidoreductase [Polaribacter tangerinus]